MSQANVDFVRNAWKPFEGVNIAALDFEGEFVRQALEATFSPDIELKTLDSGLGTGVGQHYRGLDGLQRYLEEWFDPFSEYYIENLDYIEAGDCVLVPSRQWGVGSGSGARVELELTQLFEIRDGAVTRWHQYDTLDEARADAAS
jgi:ketosteroid isomerase-like protein